MGDMTGGIKGLALDADYLIAKRCPDECKEDTCR